MPAAEAETPVANVVCSWPSTPAVFTPKSKGVTASGTGPALLFHWPGFDQRPGVSFPRVHEVCADAEDPPAINTPTAKAAAPSRE